MVSDEIGRDAVQIINNMLDTRELFWPGRRNDDAVNLCCVMQVYTDWCSCLSVETQIDKFFKQYKERRISAGKDPLLVEYNIECAKEHIDRILPYSDNWYDEDYPWTIIDLYADTTYPYMQV